jgi:hypothetical protein
MFRISRNPIVATLCLSLLAFAASAQTQQEEKQPPAQAPDSTPSSSSPSSAPSSSSPSWHNPAKYNPKKLIPHAAKSANDQLASSDELEIRLTNQLQTHGILAKDAILQDACSSFKSLAVCVAVLRISHDLKLEFACLKWDVTGVKPASVSDSCAGPSDGKAMSLRNSIALLAPAADAKSVADDALKTAHDDVKDASS